LKRLKPSHQFKKDLKRLAKRGNDLELARDILNILANEQKIPEVYQPHFLHGEMEAYLECHIRPDWLLIWKEDREYIYLVRTGTHSDLFK